jgi:hypothetical protein
VLASSTNSATADRETTSPREEEDRAPVLDFLDDLLRVLSKLSPRRDHRDRKRIIMVDTTNWQMVGVRGETIVVLLPKKMMTPEQALVHAAFLISLADPSGKLFPEILKQVQNA